ncbi:MAG: tetratricopeptide repeat protein [Geminicoccaceae bacterium]|nr:tetratricopeptide repeat protein [Geminicoccaceae bacterium]
MRLLAILFSIAAAIAAVLPGESHADQNDPRLGPLFERLHAAADAEDARRIEARIWIAWATVADKRQAALLARGSRAMNSRDFEAARLAFDTLVSVAPEFAEGWNKRATLNYLTGDLDASVRDIQRTLVLEPRHFGALSGLGLIMLQLDRPRDALRSFEAALAIHPHMPAAEAHVATLRERLRGEPL